MFTRFARRTTLFVFVMTVSICLALPAPSAADESAGIWQPSAAALAAAQDMARRYDGVTGQSCTGGLTQHAALLEGIIKKHYPGIQIDGYACRANTAAADKLSVHAVGRALDLHTQGSAGDATADWLLTNAPKLGIQLIIWQRRIWTNRTGNVRAYGGPNPHTDHIHVEVFNDNVTTLPDIPITAHVRLEG